MKILVTGANGYVGKLLCDHLGLKHEVVCTGISMKEEAGSFRCDLTHRGEVEALMSRVRPDAVVHAAGLKDIAFCENNPKVAFAVNAHATENVAAVFGKRCRVLYISTDYVFSGLEGNYGADDVPMPQTVYGKSKMTGERLGLEVADGFAVIRTAALYNEKSKFIEYLNGNLRTGCEVSCFTDTHYSPTYYLDLVRLVEYLLVDYGGSRRIFHASGPKTSRFEFAKLLARVFGYDEKQVVPEVHTPDHWFLFPDLSLKSSMDGEITACLQTSHETALRQLADTLRRL